MELIDRQQAIDALKEHRALYCDNTPKTFSKLSYVEKSRVDELDTAIATLVNLPTVQPFATDENVGDAISRQAVIDALKRFKPEIIPYEKARWYVEETIDTMHNRFEELPTIQPEPQWIPCSERLPEKPGYYITSNEYGGVTEDFYCDDYFWNADRNAYKVIAWMPKPEHYKPNNK